MRRKKSSNHNPKVRDNYRLRTGLSINKKKTISTLRLIKKNTIPSKLFDTFRAVVTKEVINESSGCYAKRKLSDLINRNEILFGAPFINELVWSISVCILNKDKINIFIKNIDRLETAVMNDDAKTYGNILNNVEYEFGSSLWLADNKISAMQHWYGVEAKRELIRELRQQAKGNPLVDVIINFIGKRVEDASIPGYLQSELSKLFKHPNTKLIEEYVKTKIFHENGLTFEQMGLMLSLDNNSCIIDLYESLIKSLQCCARDENTLKNMKNILHKPISVLYKSTKDKRLIPILICLGIDFEFDVDLSREEIIECYTAGKYEDVVNLSAEYFKVDENKTDISILFISLKSSRRINQLVEYDGFLKIIANDVNKVMMFDENSYESALVLNSINNKFLNQTWSSYLKMGVMNELTVQEFVHELDYLRELYIRDKRISPFSFLLSTDEQYIIKNIKKFPVNSYSLTKLLLELTTTGAIKNQDSACKISNERYLKYLGRFYLKHGIYDKAADSFEKALEYTSKEGALKCHAAIITAKARAGYLDEATERLVSTFLEWSAVPTTLPIEEIVEYLDQPSQWPTSISLPLTLAIYTNFYKNTKIAHLRYAFETFNIDNDIATPSDLLSSHLNINREHVKLYLQLVWRPEIMGQTLLYNGTKEIEEARIQVCKVLLELDSENSSDYQTEIRERVKNLELTKATKLVDQSRVYVDVAAIKKSLKSRLGDVYSKYRNSIKNTEEDNTEFVEVLGDAIENLKSSNAALASLMANVQMIGDEDMQFAAFFSEVVNEFLLGDHGLNAYLSTRVRHGKFSNSIRKPIADENLITEKIEGNEKYAENTYWLNQLNELNDTEKNNVIQLLEIFGKKIDDIISFVRDELIQVQVINEKISPPQVSNALFVYRITSFERMYARTKIHGLDNIDSFIDFCIDILWEKTDKNLLAVKEFIQTTIKPSILNAFEKLNESLGLLGYSDRLGELHNHIARAKTNTQHQLTNILSWFTRNEVYDRPDYAVDFPVLIAQTMVSNLISGADNWNGIVIEQNETSSFMPGRTLDGMVDVFCASFENAIEHSLLPINKININVRISYNNNIFEATVKNNIHTTCRTVSNENKLAQIRTEINKKDSRIKAQKEKGSGFLKVWSTINSPQYKDPQLTFDYIDDELFSVNIKFKIEVTDDNNPHY